MVGWSRRWFLGPENEEDGVFGIKWEKLYAYGDFKALRWLEKAF